MAKVWAEIAREAHLMARRIEPLWRLSRGQTLFVQDDT
jgi:hypothetical protein